jgi:flagellar hook protein FlgE
MSIIRTMSIGASGLRSHSEALSAVGDNIANVNTVGYKRERAVFEDVLGRSVAGGNALPSSGSGSRLAHIERMWTQGALINTGAPTDLAISGDGLFIVNGNVDGVTSNFYTRAGQFSVDAEGYMVNPDNLRLQGYPADDTGALSATLGDLRVTGTTIPATPTANVTIPIQLDSNTPVTPFDINNPGDIPNQPVTIFDSLGNARPATVYFEKTAAGWTWHATIDAEETAAGGTGRVEVGFGNLTFDANGALTDDSGGATTWDFGGGAAIGQAVTFDFGTSTLEGGTGFDGSTGLAQEWNPNGAVTQDGFAGGTVSGIRIEGDGTVTGVFSNGQLRTLGAVATADFTSVDSLAAAGHNLYAETTESGGPIVGAPGGGGRGTLISGALEGSNVDLGAEFVDLIAYQRGFQANSRIITTADEMYQEIVSLKR